MKKSKNLNISNYMSTPQKPSLTKSFLPSQPLTSRLMQSIRNPRRQQKQYQINTSRTNKQNVSNKMQTQTLTNSKKLSYSNIHQQKKSYLSQSMILSQSLLMNQGDSNVKLVNKLDDVRNQLRDLLSIDEDVESNLVEQPPDMRSIVEGIVYESIIRSQEEAIKNLQERIESLNREITIMNQNENQIKQYQIKIQQLQQQLQSKQSTISIQTYEQISYQLKISQNQNQILKKQIFNFRKQNCVVKRELSQIKKTSQQKLRQYDTMRQELEMVKNQLFQKSNWLATTQFEKQKLQNELNPNGLIIELEKERKRLGEYIYGINRSFDCLFMKLTLTKRSHENQVQQLKTKHTNQIKRLKEKIKKKSAAQDKGSKGKMKKKTNLRIKVEDESDDSIDWNLEDDQVQN